MVDLSANNDAARLFADDAADAQLLGCGLHGVEIPEWVGSGDVLHDSDRAILSAIRACQEAGEPTTPAAVQRRLPHKHHARMNALYVGCEIPSNAEYWAREVRRLSRARGLALGLSQARTDLLAGTDVDTVAAWVADLATGNARNGDGPDPRLFTGGAFGANCPDDPPAVWGRGGDVLWAEGEPLMLVGPDGTGKTTTALNLVLRYCGQVAPDFLGFPVLPATDTVLYLAADRPKQIERRWAQIIGSAGSDAEDMRRELDERLRVYLGPPPFDVAMEPRRFLPWVRSKGARSAVFIDSLGAIATGLSKDDNGSAVMSALDSVVADGIEVVTLYHPRKASGENRRPDKLEDVYGSRWLTRGHGSAIGLWGQPGDPIVSFKHLKQPKGTAGPFNLLIDRFGYVEVDSGTDLLSFVPYTAPGVSARETADRLYNAHKPADIERARRKLEDAVLREVVARVPGATDPVRYVRATPARPVAS